MRKREQLGALGLWTLTAPALALGWPKAAACLRMLAQAGQAASVGPGQVAVGVHAAASAAADSVERAQLRPWQGVCQLQAAPWLQAC